MKYIFCLLMLQLACNKAVAQTFIEAETIEQAKIKVYPADSKETADLCVYFVYETKDVVKIGFWMEVYKDADAQVTLIFVDDPAQADFSVWIVDTPQEVGWQNKDKMKLLTVDGLEN